MNCFPFRQLGHYTDFKKLCACVQGVLRNIYYRNGCLRRDSVCVYEMGGRLAREILEWSAGEFLSAFLGLAPSS